MTAIARTGSLSSLHFHSNLKDFPLLDSTPVRTRFGGSRLSKSIVTLKHSRNVPNLPVIRAQSSNDYIPDSMFYKIEAILRPWRIPQVSTALLKMGIRGVTISDVRGFGAQGGLAAERNEGSEYPENKFVSKVKMEIVVCKDQVETVIDKIIDVARTGEIGDGKIFLHPIADVIRIRTGERGEKAERMALRSDN